MNTDNPKVSGVELEIRILTELCGWEWWRYAYGDGNQYELSPPSRGLADSRMWTRAVFPATGIFNNPNDLPPISTDETAATQLIVPQLQARGLELVVSWPVDDRPRAQIFRVPESMALFSEQGDSAAEAVCNVVWEYLNAQPKG